MKGHGEERGREAGSFPPQIALSDNIQSFTKTLSISEGHNQGGAYIISKINMDNSSFVEVLLPLLYFLNYIIVLYVLLSVVLNKYVNLTHKTKEV